mmetsp:Transcript_13317/g.55784  ORF Transcript_13317/g.55784 Transcript_13317/m.55784 type:complete len:227 (+) Transcript_13317:1496-2176(+)
MRLMHEFEQLVDHRAQELPVRAQEARVLAHHVHDVRRDHRLVGLAARLLTQVEQIADDGDEETILLVFRHGPRNGSDGPAQRVEIVPAPLGAVELQRQLADHLLLGVVVVQVAQKHEGLLHGLVLHEHVVILECLAHNVAVLILNDQDLLGLCHARDHQQAQLAHRRGEERALGRGLGGVGALLRTERERALHVRGARHALQLEEVAHQRVPVVKAHLEYLVVVDV